MNSNGGAVFEEPVLKLLKKIRMVSSRDQNIAASAIQPILDMAEGHYKLIGWEIDTTGRRLIDEICQIGAYTPTSTFSQYIMPYGDLNPFAQRRYNLRVITVTRYRMLKDLKTNKFLKTKSEVSALIDFVAWLESIKGNTKGIILVYHEVRKIAPLMLLDALKRYSLYDRFAYVVKGFCNTHPLAETKCATTMKSFSLKVLSRVLLHKEDEFGSAIDRARACYNIVQHLGQKENQKLDSQKSGDAGTIERYAAEFTRQYARSTESEEKDLIDLKNFIDRQNTFRPVFKELMKFDWVSRQNASRIRRKLVENDLDFNKLKTAFNNGGRKALQELLKQVKTASKREHSDLLTIFDCYFDPNKKPVEPNYYTQRSKRLTFHKKLNKQEKAHNSSSEAWGNSDLGSPQSGTSVRSGKRNSAKIKTK